MGKLKDERKIISIEVTIFSLKMWSPETTLINGVELKNHTSRNC
jgi:hypothetical protein